MRGVARVGRHVGVHVLLNIVPSVRKGRVLRCSGPTMSGGRRGPRPSITEPPSDSKATEC